METKICSNCKKEKPVENFWKRGVAWQQNCIPCQTDINKLRYNGDRKRHISHTLKNRRAKGERFYFWKQTLSCCNCSENHFKCLDFHHLDGTEKEYAISGLFEKVGITRMEQEINKCIILCKNCHTKLHDGMIDITDKQKQESRESIKTFRSFMES